MENAGVGPAVARIRGPNTVLPRAACGARELGSSGCVTSRVDDTTKVQLIPEASGGIVGFGWRGILSRADPKSVCLNR